MQSGPFPRTIPLFSIFKKRAGEATSIFPLPLIARLQVQLNMHQFLWISLNIFENAWKNSPDYATAMRCLIILHVQQDFEDALGSKCGKVLNMAPLYMQGLYRILNVSKHGSICLNNAWICLNISEHPSICLTMVEIFWVSLNIPENYWIKCWLCQSSQYASSSYTLKRVLNMLQVLNMPGFWIYCDIVIIITLLL